MGAEKNGIQDKGHLCVSYGLETLLGWPFLLH